MFKRVFKGRHITRIIGEIAQHSCNLSPDKKYCIEIKEHREKRSLDANAYFWLLCDQLAVAMHLPKEEVYRNAIRELGGVSSTGCFKTKDADELCRLWACKGTGWFAEKSKSKMDGCTRITFYKGSSQYNTAQMSRLIENIVQDCEAVGISTKTPAEQATLLREWGE